MRRITIRLLGSFEVHVDGTPVSGFSYAKVRALLAYLVVEAPGPHLRTTLATLLWPDQPDSAARANLSQALTTLRNAFGDKQAAEPVLLADAQHVWLNPANELELDSAHVGAALDATERHAHRSWRTCVSCAEQLRLANELYRGGFLADVAISDSDVFEEWAMLQRESLHQRTLTTLERLAEQAEWRGDYSAAVAYARRLVMLDPLQEGAQRTLMRALALNGELAAALAQYRRLQTLLDAELGTTPEAATTALGTKIRAGAVSELAAPPPPLVLPRPPTPLVGRREELAAVYAQLREGQGHALTVVGAGGIGKTRLAIEVAHALHFAFEDGIYFVGLAPLTDATQVADALARTLGVKERAQQPIQEALFEALGPRHLLLILDNFEHVIAAAALVSELLAACPGLSVLVTSRVPLQIRAERQLGLEPLAEADAVELFVQRARAAGARSVDATSAEVYDAICRRLDRLPLAIELIAVHAATLTPHELLRQLEQPLQALSQGPRDASIRHRSLRSAIQWSYDLLEAEAQRVFRALGVFVHGCTIAAVEAIVQPEQGALAALSTLAQASLIWRRTVTDQTRFFLLQTIHEFAREQLVLRSEAEAARQRHAAYFATFAMAAYVELLRPEASQWRAWIAAETDNLRVAFSYALESGQHRAALEIATGIWRYHQMVGSLREGLERLEAALVYREHVSPELQCDALRAAGVLAANLNDYERARRWYEQGVELAWHLGNPDALQPMLTNFGAALLEQGHLEDARVQLEVSLSLAQRGTRPALAKFPLGYLAELYRRLNEDTQARAAAEECLRINRELQDPEGIANATHTLGAVVLAQGDIASARRLGEEALAIHQQLGHLLGIGRVYVLLGQVASGRGDFAEALAHYRECLRLWRDRGNGVASAFVLDDVALTLIKLGDPERAATLLSVATAIRKRADVRLTATEQARREAAANACGLVLGTEAFTTIWAAGATLSFAQAIELVLRASPGVAVEGRP
jgi:predicted ATPase/DNA-binding SARP family transcriptional activator